MTKLSTTRNRFTLDEAMRYMRVRWVTEPHIAYDPAIVPQYRIVRTSSHDGTFLFSVELMAHAFEPLFARRSYFKPIGEPSLGNTIKYVIGPTRRFSVYGLVKLPIGVYPGERERVVIPVRCEYINGQDVPPPQIESFLGTKFTTDDQALDLTGTDLLTPKSQVRWF